MTLELAPFKLSQFNIKDVLKGSAEKEILRFDLEVQLNQSHY